MEGDMATRKVKRPKARFRSARGAWADVARELGVTASAAVGREDTTTDFVFVVNTPRQARKRRKAHRLAR